MPLEDAPREVLTGDDTLSTMEAREALNRVYDFPQLSLEDSG